MKKLFWGFFFIYLNFHLNFNQHSLNLLPDFAGYILLMRGMDLLEEESTYFGKARPFAMGMTVYTAVLWVGALLGVVSERGLIIRLLSLAGTITGLYISWLLIRGVAESEEKRTADFNSERLHTLWEALVVVQVIVHLLEVLLNFANMSILTVFSVLLLIMGLIVIVMYLIAWKKAADVWDALPPRISEFEME